MGPDTTNAEHSSRISSRALWLLAAITQLGFGLRLFHLDAQSVWYDESFTVVQADKPFGEMMDIVVRDAVHPPLHYILVHEWFEWIGYGPWHARMISLLFGVAAIPLLFLLTRRFANTRTSLIAALLLSVSQMSIYFSQEARSYEMALCLSLVAALALLRMLDHPSLVSTAWFVLAGSLLVYTHYYTAATLAAFGTYGLLFHTRNRRAIWSLIGAGAVIILLFLPWFAAVARNVTPDQIWDRTQEAPWFLLVAMLGRLANDKFTTIAGSSTESQILLVLAVFGLPVLAAFYRQFRNRSELTADAGSRAAWRGFTLGALMMLAPIAFAILSSYGGIRYNHRYASFAAPGMYLAVAIATQLGFRSSKITLVWTAAASALASFALWANYFAPTKPDYRAAFAPMAEMVQNGDCIVNRPQLWAAPEPHFGWTSYYRDVADLRTAAWDDLPESAASCKRVWLVWDHTSWMNDDGRDGGIREGIAELEQRWETAQHFTHPDLEIWLFLQNDGGVRPQDNAPAVAR